MSVDALAAVEHDEGTLVLRVDFTDDAAWRVVLDALGRAVDVDGDEYQPALVVVDDRRLDGATAARVAADWDRARRCYAVLVDARSVREATSGGEVTVEWLDLSASAEEAEYGWIYGQSFRGTAAAFASVEVNLDLANIDFHEFAQATGPDGVYREDD